MRFESNHKPVILQVFKSIPLDTFEDSRHGLRYSPFMLCVGKCVNLVDCR